MRQAMKSVGRSPLLVVSLISLALFLILPGVIHAQPVPPHLFTGSASIDGSPAPDGTAVSAWVQGDEVASAETAGGEYALIVHQPEGANYSGSVVSFIIAELEAHETSTWEIGEVEELALNASSGGAPYVAPASTELLAEIFRERRAIFGDVVGLEEGDILLIRSKDGDDLSVRLTADTQFRNVVIGRDDHRPVHVGDRIAAVVVEREGRLETQSVLVLTGTGSVIHVTGALIEGRLITEDGRSVPVELGLSNAVLEPGTVVTIVGHVSAETGVVRVRSLQRIEETIQRLSDHVENIARDIPDRESQARHLGRIQRLLERASGHQLKILNEALLRHPDVARLGMERALSNLDYANNAAAQAFNQALRLTGQRRREGGHIQDQLGTALGEELGPTFADLVGAFGIPETVLTRRLADGTSIAEMAREVGRRKDDLGEVVLSRVQQRIERMVADGHLDTGEARRLIDELPRDIDRQLERVFSDGQLVPEGVPFSVPDLAQVLGLEPSKLFGRFQEGDTLLEIARQQDISRTKLLESLVDLARSRARSLVDQGAIDHKDVERFLRRIHEGIERHLEEASPPRNDGSSVDTASASGSRSDTFRPLDPPEIQGISGGATGGGEGLFSLRQLALALGMQQSELRRSLENADTLRDLAEEQGVGLDQLASRLVAPMEAKLREMINRGQLSEDRAQFMITEFKEGIAKRIAEPLNSDQRESHAGSLASRINSSLRPYADIPVTFEDAAQILGAPSQELLDRLQHLPRLVEEHGFTPEEFTDALLALARQRLNDQALQGEIPEEKVRQMLQHLRQRLHEDLGVPGLRPSVHGQATASQAPQDNATAVHFELRELTNALGLSPDELRRAISQGKSLRELAEQARVSLDQLVDSFRARQEIRLAGSAGENRGDQGSSRVREPNLQSSFQGRGNPLTLEDVAQVFGLPSAELISLSSGDIHQLLATRGLSPESLASGILERAPELSDQLGLSGDTPTEKLRVILQEVNRILGSGLDSDDASRIGRTLERELEGIQFGGSQALREARGLLEESSSSRSSTTSEDGDTAP